MNRGLSFRHGSRRRMSRVDNQTLSPGWYGGVDRWWASAWVLCLWTACWSCWVPDPLTLSELNQKSTAGTSDGCPSQGNKEGWYPSMLWKGVRPVECWQSEFCAYSAQRRKRFQPCWFWWQKLRRYRPMSWIFCSVWQLDCGWYPDVRLTETPRRLKKARQTLEVNWGPRSETMSSGSPKFLKTWWNSDCMAVGSPGRGINLQAFENRSTTTRTQV